MGRIAIATIATIVLAMPCQANNVLSGRVEERSGPASRLSRPSMPTTENAAGLGIKDKQPVLRMDAQPRILNTLDKGSFD
ncbi:MAG: hypothetical protein K2X81_06435, partial [Candidatus Obscuribacterales bacterium]|nr:hypothetical protein [Candidatus Obscuribacterales bacterium]